VLLVLNRTEEALEAFKTSFLRDPDKRRVFEEEFPQARSIKEFRPLLKK
jgi:hypothetical protein